MKRIFLPLLVATAAFIPGCSTVQQISEGTASLAATAGVISPDQAQSITRTTGAMTKAFDITAANWTYWPRCRIAPICRGAVTARTRAAATGPCCGNF